MSIFAPCKRMASHATKVMKVSPVKPLRMSSRFMSIDYADINSQLVNKSPVEIMAAAIDMFGENLSISFSGAEDVVLIDLAKRTGKDFRVFSLDTGRLHTETYDFFSEVESHYGIKIEFTFPEADAVKKLVNAKGMHSFLKDGHKECCGVRKVGPLIKQLKTLDAWVTGQRKDQSPGTRQEVPVFEKDPVFDGRKGVLSKFNPLANVTSAEVWTHIRENNVPFNKCHEKGMISLGCAPCTRSILPGMHEREGRWWWETAADKECGLHAGNQGYTGQNQQKQ